MKIPYETHSTGALEVELKNIKKLLILVSQMKKPDNFTYVDVMNLHNHLGVLKECIEEQLNDRTKV